MHGSEAPPSKCPMLQAKKSKQFHTNEMEVETLNGIFWVSCTPIFNDAGKLEKIIHIAPDITERKKAELALREEIDRVQTYLNIAGVMFVVINRSSEVILINKIGCEIFGALKKKSSARTGMIITFPNRRALK